MSSHISVSSTLVKLFQDLAYWLEEDDYFEAKYLFLQYLLQTSPNFDAFSSFQQQSSPKELLSESRSSRASIASFPLNSISIQYCIDLCPYIFDRPSLIYFLNSIGAIYRGEPLAPSFFNQRSFNFRLRSSEPVYSGRFRVFPQIDKFLSENPNFRKQFIELLSKGNFDL